MPVGDATARGIFMTQAGDGCGQMRDERSADEWVSSGDNKQQQSATAKNRGHILYNGHFGQRSICTFCLYSGDDTLVAQ